MSTETTCSLCLKNAPLCDSHLIPAFVFRWLKETGATNYLRSAGTPNVRRQDGPVKKMLCENCEQLFGRSEKLFAENIFSPYLAQELDSHGFKQGHIKEFSYEEWMLKFVISVQWRVLARRDIHQDSKMPERHFSLLNEAREVWRDFLLGKRSDSGRWESHLIFLENVSLTVGTFPAAMSDSVNLYFLRSADQTTPFSRKELAVYTKLGPIVIWTALKPERAKDVQGTRLKMKGKIPTAQKIGRKISDFIFIARPSQAIEAMQFSEEQQKRIAETIRQNPDRYEASMTFKAQQADQLLNIRRSS